MTIDAEIHFYLRHRGQISEWAKLEKRVDDLMAAAVEERSIEKAANLWKGQSGVEDVDFYVRNRSLISQWDDLQAKAGHALHEALLTAGEQAGVETFGHKRGVFELRGATERLGGRPWDDHHVRVCLRWTRQHLLTTGRGYPYPQLSLEIHPDTGERGDALAMATRATALELGMSKKGKWDRHWCVLSPITESQDLKGYAEACVARLQEASDRLYPLIAEEISRL